MMTTTTAPAAIGNKNATNLLLQKVSKYFSKFQLVIYVESFAGSRRCEWVGTAFDFAVFSVFHFDYVATRLVVGSLIKNDKVLRRGQLQN